MKWFRNSGARLVAALAAVFLTAATLTLAGSHLEIRAASAGLINYGTFHDWLQNTEAGTAVESALYRLMALPTGDVLYRRPPQESRPELNKLLTAASPEAALYSLRALQNEQALDFIAAEKDWKLWVDHAPDHTAAELDLAAFYGRRLRPQDEIAALTEVGSAPSPPSEKFTRASEQRSWQAFEHILSVAQDDGLKPEIAIGTYQKWIARYPAETSVYSRYFDFLLAQKRFDEASNLRQEHLICTFNCNDGSTDLLRRTTDRRWDEWRRNLSQDLDLVEIWDCHHHCFNAFGMAVMGPNAKICHLDRVLLRSLKLCLQGR